VASAVGGALAGVHPTGTPVVDPLYGAAVAAIVTVSCSQAKRWSWLVLTGVAVILSRGWLLVPSAAALGAAFASVFPERRQQRVGALVGALAVQALLRWPPEVFHGFTAAMSLVAVAPCLVSAYVNASPRWQRRLRWVSAGGAAAGAVLALPLVIGAALAHGPLTRGIAEAQGALDAVGNGGGATAHARLATASADFAASRHRTTGWWTTGAYLIPAEAQQRRALNQATAAGYGVATVAEQISGSLATLRTSYHKGQIDLSRLAALSGPLRRLDAQIVTAQHQLVGTYSPWLIEPIQSGLTRLHGQLARAASTTELAQQAIPVLPGILGADGPRHYFVAFMTPSESRGLDGFIGSYGVLTADHGHLSLSKAGPIAQLDHAARPGQRHITGMAEYLARYGQYSPADFFEDSTYSPDFPTVSQVISELYPQSGGEPIDGVLAIDPYGLAALLHFTGPISVAGLPERLTAANAAQVLTVEQYLQFGSGHANQILRHDLLQEALRTAFTKLTSGSLPSPNALATRLDPAVRQGRLLFWSNHPSEQPLLRRIGLAGAFPPTNGGDLLAITTQNAANNKIDAYLHRRIDDQVTFDPSTGSISATVTVALTNDAPSSGLPAYVIGNYTGHYLPSGTNYTWLTAYSPLKLTSATIADEPLPFSSGPELGVSAYSTHLIIPPTNTVVLTLHLSGRVAAGPSYSLALRSQPMVNPDQDWVDVMPAPGWIITGRTGPAGGSEGAKWSPNGADLTSSETVTLRR
jgi:hypothetical protein